MTATVRRGAAALRRVLAGAVIAGIVCFGLAGASLATASPARAQGVDQSLPTWDDVEKAKQNEAAAAAKVTEINGLIEQVEAQVEQTRQESARAQQVAMTRQDELQVAALRADQLLEEAERSRQLADEAAEQAATLVGQMYRSGGVDRNVELFLETDGDTADMLLERLAIMSKATERNTSISEEAQQATNTAASLGAQADEAVAERDRLWEEAEREKERAQAAAEQKRLELIAQEDQLRELKLQLAALEDETVDTVAGYEERLRQEEAERKRIEEELRRQEEERRRQEEAERQRQIEEQQRNATGGANGGGGAPVVPAPNPGVPTPPPTGAGWVNPLGGAGYWVSTEWWGYYGHNGIDLAIGQGTPIYAASSGTVTMSGWYDGGYGYMVEISHDGGLGTWYLHQMQPPLVGIGQWVEAGQVIGYVGTTGNSTGPHLHFSTLVYGQTVNPRPFMADRGVYF